jgi:hypothetical protein
VLVAASESRPLALVVKARGAAGVVMEVPHAIGDGVRDLGLRLSASLQGDALLLGFEHGGAARGGPAMRLMHIVATTGDASSGNKVVVLRPSPETVSELGVVGVGAWGGESRIALSDQVKKAFGNIGLKSTDRPLDLAVRELGARSIFGNLPMVAAVVDATAVRELSLDEARGAARVLAAFGFPSLDTDLPSAAAKLAEQIPNGLSEPSEDVVDLGRRVASEQSVIARRSLEAAIANSAARAALVRSSAGDFLLVVEKRKGGFVAAATPTDPNLASPTQHAAPKEVASLKQCSDLQAGGVCRAEAL